MIFQAGHELIYIPPWSPELNPIENIFSIWKSAFKKLEKKTEQQVDEAIKTAATEITQRDCESCFNHSQTLYAKCIRMEDI